MKLRVCCIGIFSLILCPSLKAQNLEQSFALAKHLSEQRQYQEALDLFERVVFFDSASVYRHACFHQMALANRKLGRFPQAIDYYTLSFYSAKEKNRQKELQFEILATRLLNKDFISAQEDLFVLEDLLEAEDSARFFFYKGLTAFASGNFDSAEVYLAKYLGDSQSIYQTELQELFRKNEKISRINPKTARILSILLPGLGQFYAGDIKNGLNSLVLSTGIIVLAIHLGITVAPLDAVLIATPWFVRYYQGGYRAAERIAEEKILRKRTEVFQKIMDILARRVRD